MFKTLFPALLVLCLGSLTAAAQEAAPLWSADKPQGGWTFNNGAEFPGATGSIAPDPDTKHNGQASLKLTGDFTKGGNYVDAGYDLDVDVRHLSFWLKGSTTESMTVRVIDGTGQCHQINLAIKPTADWQEISFPLAAFFANRGKPNAVPGVVKYEYWGGAKDGKWHAPARGIHFLLGARGAKKVRTVWISGASVITAAPSEAAGGVSASLPLEEVVEGEVDWQFSLGQEFPGAKGSLTAVKEGATPGRPALKLAGDFTAGGQYIEALKDLKPLGMLDMTAVRMKVKSDNVSEVGVRLIDGTGQVHQAKGVKIDSDGQWHELALVPSKLAGGEHWNGANDGKWHGAPAAVSILVGPASDKSGHKQPVLYIADATADALLPGKMGASAYSANFEKDEKTPAGWEGYSTLAIDGREAFKGSHSLVLSKPADKLADNVSAAGPSFAVTAGTWEIKLASKSDLNSQDNSYNAVISLQSLDADGRPVGETTLVEEFRKNPWKSISKQVDIPAGAVSARFRVRINKETPGRVWLDELSAARVVAVRKDDRIQRLMFTTAQLGNLLLPQDSRQVTLTLWASKPIPASQQTVACTVTDYWGAEQSAPIPVALKKKDKAGDHWVYEGTLDLSAVKLAVGRYYEIHGKIERGDADPFTNYTSLAILPEAPANAYKPEEIPFTSRNWDNRIGEYIKLTHRLGIRIVGLWGGWDSTPPYKPYAPQIELVRKLGMGIVTGVPTGQIERRAAGWEKYDEKALRQGVDNFIKQFGDVRPLIFSLGNEPHNKGDAVKPDVNGYRIVYDEVKKVDPSVIVVGTSVGTGIEDYFKAGFGQWCDVYDFHTYEDAIGIRKVIGQSYPAMFKKYGFAKPIWATEVGLNSQGMARQFVAAEVYRKFANFFAVGGQNISWFTILYPDPSGTQGDSFGSAHNVFDSRYSKYAPKLDAIAYYNAVNSILIKKFVQEKQYGTDLHAFLFRDKNGQALQVQYKDKGRADVFIPLPGVNDVRIVRLDGSISHLDAGGKGITLTICEDPILLLYGGGEALPDALGKPPIRLEAPPAAVVRSEKTLVRVALDGVNPDQVSLTAQPFWTVEKVDSGKDEARFALGVPETSTARAVDTVITLTGDNGKPSGELFYRPAVTGALAVQLLPVPAANGKPMAVKVLVSNNSPQKQEVTWELALSGEQSLKGGNFTPVQAATAYFADTPTGAMTLEGKQSGQAVVPLADADAYKVYRARVTAKDVSGRLVSQERPIGGFVHVPKAKQPPSLDGVLDEADWGRAPVQKLDNADQFFAYKKNGPATWQGPKDLSADIRFLWDAQYLYVGVAVTDDIAGDMTKPNLEPWQTDGLQFLIDPMRTSDQKIGKYDYALAAWPDGARTICYLSADSGVQMGPANDIKVVAKRGDAGNITYEIAIPWKNVAPFKPALGADLGLTMLVNEDDGHGRDSFMTWFGNASNKDIDKVGDLILGE